MLFPPFRLTWLDRFVPFDFAVPFHMLVAVIGGILAIVHASCHMLDYLHAVRLSQGSQCIGITSAQAVCSFQ